MGMNRRPLRWRDVLLSPPVSDKLVLVSERPGGVEIYEEYMLAAP